MSAEAAPAPASGEPRGLGSAWTVPGLQALVFGALASNIGNWIQVFSEQWLVLELAGKESAAQWAGRISFASGFAVLLFTPLGGVWADRFNRRAMLAAAQAWLMLLALAMGLLAWRGSLGLHGLLAFAAASGLGSAFSIPLMQSLVGDLVPPEHLPGAMGILSSQFNLSRILGPSLAALLMIRFGVPGNFFLNALSFLAFIFVVLRLEPKYAPPAGTLGGTYRDAFRAVRATPELEAAMLLGTVAGLFAWSYFTFLPLYGKHYLGLEAQGVAFLLGCFGVGAVLGSLLVARARSHGQMMPKILSGYVGFAGGLLGLALAPQRHVTGLTLFAMGLTQATFLSLMNGLVQQTAPPALRGRVNALYATALIGLTPLGNLAAGEIAARIGFSGPRWVLGAEGLIMIGSAVWVRLRAPRSA